MNIYVGNISWNLSDDGLAQAFAQFGTVKTAKVIMDKETGRSKGFGFVTMETAEEGQKAIAGLDGKELGGRAIRVNEARPQERKKF